ncbi:MAG TPA: TasA family protein [Aquihabitans sp.]|jgi:hypothetical protein|nr:TasA family protein [Aquihabitans sp.]
MSTTPAPRRSRRILAPLATLVVAGAIAVGSGASFTSASTNPANVYATGTLTQSNSKANAAIFNLTNMKPGDTLNGDVTITNTGTLPSVFSLAETGASNGFVTPANLKMTVTNTATGAEVFTGTFGTLGTKNLGTFAAGEARTYRFSVVLDINATNAEQGKTATATYEWNGAQTAATTTNQGAATPALDTKGN